MLYQKQWDNNKRIRQWKIIEFYSKQIDPHLIKHPIMVKECLAIAYSLNHWKHFLLRKKFFLDTDHKNLISLYDDDETKAPEMRKKPIFHTLRDATALFHFEIAHLAGKDIILADYLSRDGVVNATDQTVRLLKPQIKDRKERCMYLQAMDTYGEHREKIFAIAKKRNQITIPDYKLLNKYSGQVFTMQTLNQEYKNQYGYDCSDRNFTSTLNAFKQCTKKLNIDKKENTSIAATPEESVNKTEANMEANGVESRLAEGMINMLKNRSKMDPPTMNKFVYLFQLYGKGYDDTPSTKLRRNLQQLNCANTVTTINYETDEQFRRRGKRKRKQTRPFWEQSTLSQKESSIGNGKQEEGNESSSEENGNMDEKLENMEKVNTPDNHYSVKQSRFRTMFPYTVTPNLAEELYGRLHLPEQYSEVITLQNVQKHQRIDWLCQHLYALLVNNGDKKSEKFLKERFPFILKLFHKGEFQLRDGVIYRIKPTTKKLVIPSKLIHPILEYEHKINNLQHPGVIQMRRQMNKRFYWYKMDIDIQEYVSQCHLCQIGKGGIHYKQGKLAPSELTYHGHTVHFDFAGPFWKKVSVLVMICQTTGYVELAVTDGQKTAHVIFALMHKWYPRHGMPVKLVTDRGKGFISEANRELGKVFGIHNVFTSAYHPQTNAKAERVVQELKKALRMVNINMDERYTPNKLKSNVVNQLIRELTILIPTIQFTINQRIHSITKVSPHMLVYGSNLRSELDHKLGVELMERLSKEIGHPSKYELVKQLKYLLSYHADKQKKAYQDHIVVMKENFDMDKHDDDFEIGDLVAYYIGDRSAKLRKIRQRFSAPWRVIGRLRHNVVQIQDTKNPEEKLACHVSMLKKYCTKAFVPLTEVLATQSEKDKIKMKQKAKEKKLNRKKRLPRKSKKPEKVDQAVQVDMEQDNQAKSELNESSDQ